ncbi:hypothetical protein RN001_003057 [Aquatica leii]|uniref:Mutator-like transposase domain-containing protein n=1 Tax=Aquatica leii TaxID=1421715 RepID=A0AAN7SDP5_9COLE|nr:hypothetical protein RN001_003057 [Aquatica leii]
MDLPIMSSNYFRKLESIISEEWETVLQKQMLETGKEEARCAIEAGDFEDGIPFITVIIDGGWAKRSYGHGFSSLSGVAVIIGKKTGKLLYLGITESSTNFTLGPTKSGEKYYIAYNHFMEWCTKNNIDSYSGNVHISAV